MFFALLLLSACKKEEQPVPGAFGRITEFGTEIPVANARMELYRCNSDAFGSACFLQDSVFTNSQGRYEISYNPDAASYHILTPVADKYFPGLEKILNSASRIEQDFVLDPFAWLNVRIMNEVPAGEFDRINYAGPGALGSPDAHIGEDINITRFSKVRGNRQTFLYWFVNNTESYGDTLVIPAHDTLNYEIRY